MNNSAIQRNLIKVPKRLSLALFLTAYLGYWVLIPWHMNLFIVFIGSVGWGILGLFLMDILADYLARERLENWASEYRGVHPDDLDLFLKDTDPEELEKMVATDFEGWSEED